MQLRSMLTIVVPAGGCAVISCISFLLDASVLTPLCSCLWALCLAVSPFTSHCGLSQYLLAWQEADDSGKAAACQGV